MGFAPILALALALTLCVNPAHIVGESHRAILRTLHSVIPFHFPFPGIKSGEADQL